MKYPKQYFYNDLHDRQDIEDQYRYALTIGGASLNAAYGTLPDPEEEEDLEDPTKYDDDGYPIDEDGVGLPEDISDEDAHDGFIYLTSLGEVSPTEVLDAVDEISDRYLTDLEGDLIDLMKKGRRPVEISRILKIPECEVVRLRRNCFRKIRTVFQYDYYRDKKRFVVYTIETLKLNEKQSRILTMFFDYHGLRPIAEVIGTRPSNIHRSLESIKNKLGSILPVTHEFYPFLAAFQEFKYLNLRSPGELT